MAWLVAAVAGAIVAGALASIAVATARGVSVPALAANDKIIVVLIAACGLQITMLLGSLIQARRAGEGSIRAGLGWRPMRRKLVIALLCLAALMWMGCFIALTVWFPALRDLVKSATPDLLAHADQLGLPGAIARVLLLAALAPLSEEFFFRGWLWEALRTRGVSTLPIALLTTLPWLLLHGLDTPWRIVFLLPAALIFSTARIMSRGVQASLCVHVTNNLAIVLLQIAAAASGASATG